ncbi:hypothetical protein ACFL02_01350 [Planctomycetota bacterium]
MAVNYYKYLFIAAVIVFAGSSAGAAPAITFNNPHAFVTDDYSYIQFPQPTSSDDANRQSRIHTDNFYDYQNSALADAGRQMLVPPQSLLYSTPFPKSSIRSLPALPGAILMGVTGFLTVTMVRDRKFWMSVFTGLILLSHAGMQTIPMLTNRLARGWLPVKQPRASATDLYNSDRSLWPVGSFERTLYVGLLHRLAGSNEHGDDFINMTPGINTWDRVYRLTSDAVQLCSTTVISLTHHAFLENYYGLSPSLPYRADRPEPLTYFSPAFIFVNLPRGPP